MPLVIYPQEKKEESLTQEKVHEIVKEDNKVIINVEEQKVQEFIPNSKKTHKEDNNSKSLHVRKIEQEISEKSSNYDKDPSAISFEKSGNRISEEVISRAKRVILEVKSGGKIEKGLKIELNAAGYKYSTRQAYDGVTFFGNEEFTLFSVLFALY